MIIIFTKDWTYKNRTHKKHTVSEMISFAAVQAISEGCAVAAPKGMSVQDIIDEDYIEKHFKKQNTIDANDDLGDAKPPKGWQYPWNK